MLPFEYATLNNVVESLNPNKTKGVERDIKPMLNDMINSH